MVRVHFGKREAYLRLLENEVAVCNKEGRVNQSSRHSFQNAEEAIEWLASFWKIRSMRQYDTNDPEDYSIVYPSDRILVDLKTVGELTLKEELDWLMFNRKRVVYNVCDEQLWVVDSSRSFGRYKLDPSIEGLPDHRLEYREEWSVPEYPDECYLKFEKALSEEFDGVPIDYYDRPGHYTVARLTREEYPHRFLAVEIKTDNSLGIHRVTKLTGESVKVRYMSDSAQWDLKKHIGAIRRVMEKYLVESWESFFPKEWDVIMVQRGNFDHNSFAGHCYRHENFIGMSPIPPGYAIAWENSYGDMLLLRVSKQNTVRCPDNYKGKIIGTHGVNIKRVAKLLGKEHWQVRLV